MSMRKTTLAPGQFLRSVHMKKSYLGKAGYPVLSVTTPYNVGSVLRRLFSTLEVVQYIGGITSVLWGDSFSTVGG